MIGHKIRLLVAVLALDLLVVLVIDDAGRGRGKAELLHQLFVEVGGRGVELFQQGIVALICRIADLLRHTVPIALSLGFEQLEPFVILVLTHADVFQELAAQLLQGSLLL